ncbi:hypothetical protein [Candidatus Binatus sp.]|uniref:hypothetical protein n=1 Tax=Candidatus Binatus sp. TaxID=2811406 RepID=UPI003C553199
MEKRRFYIAFRINLYCDISNCIVPFNANLIDMQSRAACTLMDESRTSHLYALHRAPAPESKVARRANLRFSLGAPVTPRDGVDAARRAGD